MAYEWAVPGAKVVCVDPKPPLRKNQTYEIERIIAPYGSMFGPHRNTKLLVVISGHRNPEDRVDGSFAVERFRPAIQRTQSQDVAKFTRLLTPQKQEERV